MKISPFPVAALFVLPLSFSVPALAYVPPSAFIVQGIAKKHAGIKGARVKTVVTAMEGESPGSARFKTVTHFNPATGVLRAYALDDSGQKLYAVERRSDSATAADALLFWPNAKSLALALKAKGVPIRTEEELAKTQDADERRANEELALARWNGKVAWVIGKDGGGRGDRAGKPQLWVEKDAFIPLRLIAPTAGDSSLAILELEGTRLHHEFPFPRAITLVRGKTPVLRDETQDVALALDAGEFRSALVPGFTEAGESAPSAVRELIQRYFESVR